MKKFIVCALGALVVLCGCQTRIVAEKHPEVVLPVYRVATSNGTNTPYIAEYIRASGGWEASARSPLWATEELRGLQIAVTTNGTVSLGLDAYNRDLSTNAVIITEKLIDGAVELTAKVTAAVVTYGGSEAASGASSAIRALVAKFVAAGGDASNASVSCTDGSCTITDGAISCTDGVCSPK